MKKVKEEGYNTHRHKENPKEKELHDCFREKFNEEDMNYLVFGQNGVEKEWKFLSTRERRIVISTIQWIGSPTGQGFLRNCGLGELKTYMTKERLTSQKIACLQKQLDKIPNWVKAIFK